MDRRAGNGHLLRDFSDGPAVGDLQPHRRSRCNLYPAFVAKQSRPNSRDICRCRRPEPRFHRNQREFHDVRWRAWRSDEPHTGNKRQLPNCRIRHGGQHWNNCRVYNHSARTVDSNMLRLGHVGRARNALPSTNSPADVNFFWGRRKCCSFRFDTVALMKSCPAAVAVL